MDTLSPNSPPIAANLVLCRVSTSVNMLDNVSNGEPGVIFIKCLLQMFREIAAQVHLESSDAWHVETTTGWIEQ